MSLSSHPIRRDTRASTTVEMALVLPLLVPILLGGIELGMVQWTKSTLQSVAAITARCVSIGSSACSNPQQYAVTLATSWLGSGKITQAITTSSITISAATTCKAATGSFKVVTISASPWGNSMVYPFKSGTMTVTACFPA